MKPFIRFIVVGFMVLGTGCAQHYYRLNADTVDLYLREPDAGQVNLMTSLDDFAPHRAGRINGGTWRTTVPAGREFRYFYTVDGRLFLPECRLKEKDDFGTENCVFDPKMM